LAERLFSFFGAHLVPKLGWDGAPLQFFIQFPRTIGMFVAAVMLAVAAYLQGGPAKTL